MNALSDTQAGVFICDVAGHGVRSALVTAMIRALVEELRPLAHDPGAFMTKLNSDLHTILKHSGTPVLTTAFYLVADSTTGVMKYSNAGHPKPLLVRRASNAVEQLKNAGNKSQTVLALSGKSAYTTSELKLEPRDLLILFTDGLYEVINSEQKIYTQEMLTDAARKFVAAPADGIFDGLIADVRQFSGTDEFEDDVCIVAMEFTGAKV